MKLYVTASAEVRAHRRWLEHKEAGHDIDEAQVLSDVKARDTRDSERADAPLRAAEDAVVIDTSDLTIDAAFALAEAEVARALEG